VVALPAWESVEGCLGLDRAGRERKPPKFSWEARAPATATAPAQLIASEGALRPGRLSFAPISEIQVS
jgi:hypothetical protein